ncbi:hypothetical protein C8R42DRAFT_724442 [Lentinula raphanica]|nr:hypothetical protein C8R42DRAFT_724442 [Lentinula raphanica]
MNDSFFPANNFASGEVFADPNDPFWGIQFDFNDPAFNGLDFGGSFLPFPGLENDNAPLPPDGIQHPLPTSGTTDLSPLFPSSSSSAEVLPTMGTPHLSPPLTSSSSSSAKVLPTTGTPHLSPPPTSLSSSAEVVPTSESPELSRLTSSSSLDKMLDRSAPFPTYRPTTHAERNPLLPTQEVQQRPPKRTLTTAQIRSMQEGKAAKQRQNLLLKADIVDLLEKHEQAIEELASKYSVEADYIKKLIIPVSKMKEKKAVGRGQALIYLKGKEVNEGLAVGSRLKAPALSRLAADDEELQSISDEKLQEVIKEIEENRIISTSGTRPSNVAAGANLVWFSSLSSFTSVPARWALDSWYLVATLAKPPTFLECKNECANMIASGLRYMLRNKNAKMNYENYHRSIVAQHHVRLIGLPDSLPEIIKPHNISKTETLQDLHAALQSGTCCWATMNYDEIEQHRKWMESESAEGRTVGRQRAERSDKGKKRGKRGGQVAATNDEDEDRDRPRKRRKKSAPTSKDNSTRQQRERIAKQLPPQYKSREFINDDSDDSDQGGESDNNGDNAMGGEGSGGCSNLNVEGNAVENN